MQYVIDLIFNFNCNVHVDVKKTMNFHIFIDWGSTHWTFLMFIIFSDIQIFPIQHWHTKASFFNEMRRYANDVMCRYGLLILNSVIVYTYTFHAYSIFHYSLYNVIFTLIMKVYWIYNTLHSYNEFWFIRCCQMSIYLIV